MEERLVRRRPVSPRRKKRARVLVNALLTTLVVCLGCGPEGPAPSNQVDASDGSDTSTQSLPDHFVASYAGTSERWTLAPIPDVLLGRDEHNPSGLFFRVEVGQLLPGNAFVVADGGSLEVRFYSGDGVLRRKVGGPGSGPEEFANFDVMQRLDDSLFVFDRVNARVTVLDLTGNLGRTYRVPDMSRMIGVFRDHGILLGVDEPGIAEAGYRELFQAYQTLRPDGSIKDLGRFFSIETLWFDVGDGVADAGYPFSRVGSVAIDGDDWFYSNGRDYQITQHDAEGRTVAVYSEQSVPVPATAQDLERFLEGRRGPSGRLGPWERELRSTALPERMPAYDRLLLDRSGSVWARPYSAGASNPCWHVFVRHSGGFAEACLPERFTPLDIGDDVLGVLRDENDVEQVARFRLIKSMTPG